MQKYYIPFRDGSQAGGEKRTKKPGKRLRLPAREQYRNSAGAPARHPAAFTGRIEETSPLMKRDLMTRSSPVVNPVLENSTR